jgi:hypothetical protein
MVRDLLRFGRLAQRVLRRDECREVLHDAGPRGRPASAAGDRRYDDNWRAPRRSARVGRPRQIDTMPEAAIGLGLEIALEPHADAAELEYATTQLRHELLEVDRVDLPARAPPPADTRGLELAALGTLLIGAGRAAIGPIMQAVQSWVARRSSRSVKIPRHAHGSP